MIRGAPPEPFFGPAVSGAGAPVVPEVVLSPSGRLYLEPPDIPAASPRIRRLWAEDPSLGLLELAGEKWDAPPSALLAFWRGFTRDYVTALCHTPGLETDPAAAIQAPGAEHWRAVAGRVPPMKGFEYLTSKVLNRL
jgi:hypothetical protein